MGDCSHAHRDIEFFERNVSMRLAKRSLWLDILRVDVALDNDLRFGGNQQIDAVAANDIDGCTGETAGDTDLVYIDRQLLRRDESNAWGSPEHDRARHRS